MFIWTTFLFGQLLSVDRLMEPANHFMQLRHCGISLNSIATIPGSDSIPVGYLLHYEPSGFIILSASAKVDPVIGYAHFGSCVLPDHEKSIFINWLSQNIQSRMAAWERLSLHDRQKVTGFWERFLCERFDNPGFQQWPPENSTYTEGWVETNWTQTAPYNSMCPMDLNAGARSVVGCPATAMAQIVNLHKKIHQTRLDDGDDYYHTYGAGNSYWIDDDHQSRGFPSFDSLNTLLEQIELTYSSGGQIAWPGTAALSFACGVTATQVYTSQVSGTFGLDQALISFQRFGYVHSKLIFPDDTTFNRIVADNIKIALPVQLGLLVEGGSGGHNVVADGYNTDEFYHFNFGWGGSANGWYTLPPASIPYNLTIIEGAVTDIAPVIGTSAESWNEKSKEPAVFPSPMEKEFRVAGLKVPATIAIYNQNGTLVLTAELLNSSTKVDVSHLSPGSYIYQLKEIGTPFKTGVLIKHTKQL